MTTRFEITLSPAEGALIRTLGLIQRRGFTVTRMDMNSSEQEVRVKLELAESNRCPQVLRRQIERLHDVRNVAERGAAQAGRAPIRVGRALLNLFASRPRVAVGGEA